MRGCDARRRVGLPTVPPRVRRVERRGERGVGRLPERSRTHRGVGGQLELGALAKATRRCVEVYSAGMPTIRMGEAFAGDGPSLTVCYQRHAGLGEHYNSTERA